MSSPGNLVKVLTKVLEQLERLNANLEEIEVRDEDIPEPPQKYVNDRRQTNRKRS